MLTENDLRPKFPNERFEGLAKGVLEAADALSGALCSFYFAGHKAQAQLVYGTEWRLVEAAESGYPYRVEDMSQHMGGSAYHLYVAVGDVEFWCAIPEVDAQRLMASEKAQAAATA